MTGVQKSTRLNSSHTIISYAWSSDVCSSDRKSTRLNSSHTIISYAVFCLKKIIHMLGGALPHPPHPPLATLLHPPRSARGGGLDRHGHARCGQARLVCGVVSFIKECGAPREQPLSPPRPPSH